MSTTAPIQMDLKEYKALLTKLILQTPKLVSNTAADPDKWPQEKLIVDILEDYLKDVKGAITFERHFKEGFESRPNLILKYSSGTSGTPDAKPIFTVMGAHMDVVPPVILDHWINKDPFHLIDDPSNPDKVYARGTTDCLGHVALLACMFKQLGLVKPQLPVDMWAVIICDEEDGTQQCGADWLWSTGALNPLRGNRILWLDTADSRPTLGDAGASWWSLTVAGSTDVEHSGFPTETVNAKHICDDVLIALERYFHKAVCPYDEKYQTELGYPCESSFKATSPIPIFPPWPAVNQVPPVHKIRGDIRFLPKFEKQAVQNMMLDYVDQLNKNPALWMDIHAMRGATKSDPAQLNTFPKILLEFEKGGAEGIVCKKDDGFFVQLQAALKAAGCEPNPISLMGTVPLVKELVDTLGVKLQMVGFGEEVVYHKDGEYCYLSQMQKGFNAIVNILTSCKSDDKPSPPHPKVRVDPPVPSWKDYQLDNGGMDPSKINTLLSKSLDYLGFKQSHFMGYQANQVVDMPANLMLPVFGMSPNNIGDPFVAGNFTLNNKHFEVAVLDYYSRLWHAKPRTDGPKEDPESYWGYLLTMGSTEANMYGLFNARDYLAGVALFQTDFAGTHGGLRRVVPHGKSAHLKELRRIYKEHVRSKGQKKVGDTPKPEPPPYDPAFTPIAFFSEDTHYSIVKALRLEHVHSAVELGKKMYETLGDPSWRCPITEDGSWPTAIPSEGPGGSQGSGAIDVDKLTTLVEFYLKKGYPPLIILNIGTTFKCGYDNVPAICAKLKPLLQQYKMWEREVTYQPEPGKIITTIRSGYWLHIDGALGASYVPLLEGMSRGGTKMDIVFDFRQEMVHSIVNSGHKFFGCTVPSGVYMTKVKYLVAPPSDPEYIGSPDSTFAGSRSGLSPMTIWYTLALHSKAELTDRALACLDKADFFVNRLQALQEKWKGSTDPRFPPDLWIRHNPFALAVIFRKPTDDIIRRYSLSGETLLEKVIVPSTSSTSSTSSSGHHHHHHHHHGVGDEIQVKRHYNHVYMMGHTVKQPQRLDMLLADLESAGFDPKAEEPAPKIHPQDSKHHVTYMCTRCDM